MSTPTQVVHKTEPPTPKQLYWIGKLAGDDKRDEVENWTREAASQLLSQLFAEANKAKKRTAPIPTHAHAYTGATGTEDDNVPAAPKEAPTDVPTILLDMVPDARYAIRLDEAHPWVFFRKSHPKNGQFEGCLKITTQHGPNHALCYVVWPNGTVSWYDRAYMPELKLLLIGHKRAGVDFGRKLKRCQICGLELTDKRSRKYTIGPDCETRHPEVIEYVDALISSGELEDVDD